MNAFKQAGVKHELPEPSARARATPPGRHGSRRVRKANRGLKAELDLSDALACGRPAVAGPLLSRRMSVRRALQQTKPKEKGNTVKPLNPSIQRLEERIAPGGLTLPGVSLPTIGLGGDTGAGGDACEGTGGGSSASGSRSHGTKSSKSTNSGTCHCSKHSH